MVVVVGGSKEGMMDKRGQVWGEGGLIHKDIENV